MNPIRLDQLEIGLPRAPIMQLDHWVHLLWANQVAGEPEALKTPKWLWLIRIVAAVKSFQRIRWKILSGLNASERLRYTPTIIEVHLRHKDG